MNNKFYFLKCICVIISLSIFSSCNSNSDKVKEMEKIIISAHTKANELQRDDFLNSSNINDLFTSNATKHNAHYLILREEEECHFDSITYIGNNWFKVSYDLSDCGWPCDCDEIHYWKLKKEDNKYKIDNGDNAYSQCTSQIKDLSYADRIRFWVNSRKYDDVQPYFQGNLCKVSKDDKYGFINIEGEEILPCKYDDITFVLGDLSKTDYNGFRSGDNLVRVKLDNKYGIVNLDGKEIIPCKYDDLTILFDWGKDLLKVKLDNKYGFINFEGKEIIPCKYDDLTSFEYYLIKAELDNKYGFIDYEGNEIIQCKYDDLTLFDNNNNDLFKVKSNNKYGLINLEMEIEAEVEIIFEVKELLPCLFDCINPLEDDQMLKVQRENLWGYYTIDGTQVTDFYEDIEYYYKDANNSVCNLDHPIFAVKSNGKWGYLDESFDTLIEFVLDYAGQPYKDGTAFVEYNGQYGEIDLYTGYFYRKNNNSNSYNNSISQKICPECSGTGEMAVRGGGIIVGTQRCPVCGGSGYVGPSIEDIISDIISY